MANFEAGCFRRIDGLGATHAGARGCVMWKNFTVEALDMMGLEEEFQVSLQSIRDFVLVMIFSDGRKGLLCIFRVKNLEN